MENSKMSTSIYLSDIGMIASAVYDKTTFDTSFGQTMSFIKNVLDEVQDNITILVDLDIQTNWVYSPDPEIYILKLLDYLQELVSRSTSCEVYIKIVKNNDPPKYKRIFRSVVRKDIEEEPFNNTVSILFTQYEGHNGNS